MTMRAILGRWLALLVLATFASAAEPPGQDQYARVMSSCVWIHAGREGQGTGWIADTERRWIVTCFHVVGEATSVDLVFPTWRDGRLVTSRSEVLEQLPQQRISGRVVKRDPRRDLALIEAQCLPTTARPLPLAKESSRAGEPIAIVGNRRDLATLWGMTTGHVRIRFRSGEGYPWRTQRLAVNAQLLALQAPIYEGDSGGPVVNSHGELVAVTGAILWPAQRSAAAIDGTEVRSFLDPMFEVTRPATPPDRYADLVRATVWVQAPTAANRATGFIIGEQRRHILTTADAVGPGERVEIIYPRFVDGRPVAELAAYKDAPRITAAVLARDLRRNLALVEVPSPANDTRALELAAKSAQPGEILHAICNPNGIDALWLYTAATVRQVGRVQLSSTKEDGLAAALILQAPAGAGGGPLVNAAGQLVGVAGAKDGPEQQISYAVDLAEVRSLLQETRPLRDPRTAAEYHRRGSLRLRQHWFRLAQADLVQALRLQPDHVPSLRDLPAVYRMLGQHEQALAAIETALKSIPTEETAIVLAQRAAVRNAQGQFDQALKDCKAALAVDPKCAAALAAQAEAWRGKQDLVKALADADEAIWLTPNLAAAYLTRGRIHLAQRRFDRAITDLSRVIELDPFDPVPLRERAKVFEEMTPPQPRKAQRDRAAATRLEQQAP